MVQMAEVSETVNITDYQHTQPYKWKVAQKPSNKGQNTTIKGESEIYREKVEVPRRKIKASTEKLAVNVDDSLHNGLQQIMGEHREKIHNQYEHGTFHCLFWDQQPQLLIHQASLASYVHTLVPSFNDAITCCIWCIERCSCTSLWVNSVRLHPLHKGWCWDPGGSYWAAKERGTDGIPWGISEVCCSSFDEMKIKEGIVHSNMTAKLLGS